MVYTNRVTDGGISGWQGICLGALMIPTNCIFLNFTWKNYQNKTPAPPRDIFILQLTKEKATVSESDCFASRISI